MSDEMTPAQIKRDDFLRTLARLPGQALRYWRKLSQPERITVVTYMTGYYDVTFASYFKTNADRGKRLDTYVQVTNDPQITWAYLKPRGWKMLRSDGSMTVYVHPSGNEIWVLPKPKGTGTSSEGSVPQVAPQRPAPVHPDVQEAQQYVADHSAERVALLQEANSIQARKASLSKDEYDALVKAWWEKEDQYADDVQESIDVLNSINDTLTPEEQQQLQAAKDELNRMKSTWPNTFGN